ncbi:transcription initiation factor IIA subunit 1-like [Macrosteles quadrilineatus]|uniref:transcription initiation factor IIA subunit 1-like n=1 Tax=Macrosteles quadrilineatus TaxID=74068 RepID=UPI0023E33C29|nr:transcription initiation factor IIA subunit 1-like [Macrosteles quadrilineatus]
MFLSQSSVLKLYTSVIEDVISGVRDAFLDEGVDEQVLQELKQIWESKLLSSKALEQPEHPEPQPPLINSQKATPSIPANSGAQSANSQPQIALTDFSKPVPIQITLPAQVGTPNSQSRTLTIQVPASALHGNQLHSVLTGPVISATMALPTHVAEAVLQSHVTANLQGQAMSGSMQQQQMQQQQQPQPHPQQHSQQHPQQHPQQHSQQHLQQHSQPQQHHQVLQNVGMPHDNRQPFTHHQLQNSVPQLDGQHDSSDDEEEEEEEDDDNDDDDVEDKDEEENDENEAGAEEEPLNSGDDVSEEDPTDMFDTDNVVVCQYDKITRSRNKWKFYLKDGIMNLGGKDFVFQKANGDAEW